ncbi:hypothetical protein [Burkholderia sp. BCC0397]|uniref:hypothetical protein n=1 Tax=Burkholderia sp. BCC0397 TaxID=486876 RepID=UPI00158C1ADB|nr:hypothetical protein [Burkholderia sp. BCC0397]
MRLIASSAASFYPDAITSTKAAQAAVCINADFARPPCRKRPLRLTRNGNERGISIKPASTI